MTKNERPLHIRLHEDGIRRSAEAIAHSFEDGDVALLFFEVGRGPPEMRKRAEEGAHALGWRGGLVEVSRMTKMTKARAEQLADMLTRTTPGDTAAIAWLRRHSGSRLLVLAHVGTICLDFIFDEGFFIVPGTDDSDWMS